MFRPDTASVWCVIDRVKSEIVVLLDGVVDDCEGAVVDEKFADNNMMKSIHFSLHFLGNIIL